MPNGPEGESCDQTECPEQKRLRDAVINAIQEKYKAQEQLDKARRTGQPDDQLAYSLSKAKNSLRKAEREFSQHTEHHRCDK